MPLVRACIFQSALPKKGATVFIQWYYRQCRNFNPRSQRRERRADLESEAIDLDISIRAPKEGSDRRLLFIGFRCYAFQSALPKKGATKIIRPRTRHDPISIRAPKEGSDLYCRFIIFRAFYFNPRSQRRERQ